MARCCKPQASNLGFPEVVRFGPVSTYFRNRGPPRRGGLAEEEDPDALEASLFPVQASSSCLPLPSAAGPAGQACASCPAGHPQRGRPAPASGAAARSRAHPPVLAAGAPAKHRRRGCSWAGTVQPAHAAGLTAAQPAGTTACRRACAPRGRLHTAARRGGCYENAGSYHEQRSLRSTDER